jgi:hypothetical protein
MLVVGVLLAADCEEEGVRADLARAFGEIGETFPTVPFARTYYEREMGPGIRRGFLRFPGERDPGTLAEIKLAANDIEAAWTRGDARRVNLDPGLLNLGQYVLATGKRGSHRVYVGRGIWAEVAYRFIGGGFQPLPWTYPDYREPAVTAFFDRLRSIYKEERKKRCSEA